MSNLKMDNLERARDARKELNKISSILKDISESAYVLGLGMLADKLDKISAHVYEHAEDLYGVWSDEFYAHCNSIERSSITTVEAALAGASAAIGKINDSISKDE